MENEGEASMHQSSQHAPKQLACIKATQEANSQATICSKKRNSKWKEATQESQLASDKCSKKRNNNVGGPPNKQTNKTITTNQIKTKLIYTKLN
jgi:hypothetical protein